MTAIVIHVQLTIADGQRDAFLARARQHRDNVIANEPACQRFDISTPDDDENVVRLYEVYDDQAAVDHHMQTEYMNAYREDTGPIVAERVLTMATMAHL